MATASALLPPASTPFERAFADATDFYTRLDGVVSSMRSLKLVSPPPSFLPYLVYEYGLGELTPYVANLYDLIDEGIDWQRVRGTPQALELALGWLGYSAVLEEFPPRRKHWNLFQLELDRIRENEEPDLFQIEGVAGLSVPVRSVFWRGFRGYDVRAMEYSRSKWSGALWGSYSGKRLDSGSAKWSFGRTYDFEIEMSDADLLALGVWLEPTGSEPLKWGAFPWPPFPWANQDANARSEIMLTAVPAGPAWIEFKNSEGAVIGYRRARARWPVNPAFDGKYTIGNSNFSPVPSGATRLYVEALTGFGDGFGSTAASAGVVFGGQPSAGYPLGASWLPAGALTMPLPAVAMQPINIEFGRTVRERFRFLLRF